MKKQSKKLNCKIELISNTKKEREKMKALKKQRMYTLLSTDVTTYCNARCKFCFNDWDALPKMQMSLETFKKILALLPYLPKDGFYLSCIYEPTIGKDFIPILEAIPKEYREKIFFTTNLVKKLTKKELKSMLSANLDYINISLETYDEDVYSDLVGIKNSFFYENLNYIAKHNRHKKTNKQNIRLITMMLKSNYKELPNLVKKAHIDLNPIEHEIRTPYFEKTDTSQQMICESELLYKAEIDETIKEIKALGYDNIIFACENDIEYYESRNKGDHNKAKDNYVDHFVIRIYPDGSGHFAGTNYKFNVNDLPDADDYFKSMLGILQEKEAEDYFREILESSQIDVSDTEINGELYMDQVYLYDEKYIQINGWESYSILNPSLGNPHLYIKQNDSYMKLNLRRMTRVDVVKVFNNPALEKSGFSCYFKLDNIEKDIELFYGTELDGKDYIYKRLEKIEI